jgi:hypothetical protein
MGFLNGVLKFLWDLLKTVNRIGRTYGNARATINTLVGVNEKLIIALVNTFARTNLNAGLFFVTNAGLSDDGVSIFHARILRSNSSFVFDLSQAIREIFKTIVLGSRLGL